MDPAMLDMVVFQSLHFIPAFFLVRFDKTEYFVRQDIAGGSVLWKVEKADLRSIGFHQRGRSSDMVFVPVGKYHCLDPLELQSAEEHDQCICRFPAVDDNQRPILEIDDLTATLSDIEKIDRSGRAGGQLRTPIRPASAERLGFACRCWQVFRQRTPSALLSSPRVKLGRLPRYASATASLQTSHRS